MLVKIGQLATPAQHIARASKTQARDLFHEVARCLPWVLTNYKLDEITTVKQLRSNVAKLFKQHAHLRNPGAIDMLIHQGKEELEMVLLQHKQRHHLISEYLTKVEIMQKSQSTNSPFLSAFYTSNQPPMVMT